MKLKLVPIENETQYYHVIFNYIIGDGNGYTTYDFTCNAFEIEEIIKYVDIFNRLKPPKGYWGIVFNDLPREYPGEYIGVSREEYEILMHLIYLENAETEIEEAMCDCIRSDIGSWNFLVFKGIDIYYYDESNRKYKVVIDGDNQRYSISI